MVRPHTCFALSIVLSLAIPLAAQTAPSAAPATAAATTLPRTATMKFTYENADINTVLDQMAQSFGFVIEKMTPLNGRISVSAPEPLKADEAIVLLNSLLRPLGYAAVERPARQNADGSKSRVLRVMSIDQAKKETPVRGGN